VKKKGITRLTEGGRLNGEEVVTLFTQKSGKWGFSKEEVVGKQGGVCGLPFLLSVESLVWHSRLSPVTSVVRQWRQQSESHVFRKEGK
jgi:hypothetical protein